MCSPLGEVISFYHLGNFVVCSLCVSAGVCEPQHRQRSGDNFWELVLPFQCGFVNPGDGTQVTRLLWQVL